MKITVLCSTVVLSLFVRGGTGALAAGAASQDPGSNVTSAQASGGLKEALSQGITTAVSETGKPGGFEDNPAIRIMMPDKLRTVEKGLRGMGMGSQVDGFEHSMNAAAEQAAPAANPIFLEALRSMSFTDARQIVSGDHTAGTEYFKRTTSTQLSDAFRPIIEKAMANTGVTEKFTALMGSAPKMPFGRSPTVDINAYVLEKSVDGLFFMMGQEETRIRTNPAAQVTPLLRTVFGKV